jgi:prevent-host-death family protein
MEVGVRELKQRLSEFLDLVARGEQVIVTDRGTPKAMISPVRAAGRLQEGIDDGWIRPPVRPHRADVPTAQSDRRIMDVIDEDRGE